ncbi:hypothetical protein ATANTOWER_019858, partial [Ataeniobius toweri]|nr:hypothetical protein [Ataeniobius toweri]
FYCSWTLRRSSAYPDGSTANYKQKKGSNLQQNQAQCERPSATTDWRFDRTEQRH